MALASIADFYYVDPLWNQMQSTKKHHRLYVYCEHLTMKIHPVEQLETE